MERHWSTIPVDIGHIILCKLPELVDHVWFGAVCKNWNYIAKEHYQLIRPSRGTLPMLFVPVTQCETQRRFYSMSYAKLFPNVALHDIPNKRCCGSSHGWLAFMEEDYSVTIINPFKFRGITIHLPALKIKWRDRMPRYVDNISKMIMSPDSTPDKYTAVAIYGGMCQLATIRSRCTRWTYIVGNNQITPERVTLSDIVFRKGMVYALDHEFRVFSINVKSRPPRVKLVKARDPPSLIEQYVQSYIVVSTSGDLYVLRRKRGPDPYYLTMRFKVLKRELHGKVAIWVETDTLDGDCIFMSEICQVAVKASNFNWCEPNSVYYTEDHGGQETRPGREMEDSGIYNVKEKRITRIFLRDPNHLDRPSAIWVQPPYDDDQYLRTLTGMERLHV